jgi:hypothetical protein
VSKHKALLLLILIVSAGIRIWIAIRGGQNYWPDEGRYEISLRAASDIQEGRLSAAFGEMFGHVDHALFKVIGVIPASLQVAGAPPWCAAAFFGLFSVAGIYLVSRISLVTSGNEEEALLAAAIAACSTSLLYFSRHYFPYDTSLFFSLLGLYCGLKAPSARSSLIAGAWISVGFLSYWGYWLFCGVCLILVTLYRLRSFREFIVRCAAAITGFAVPMAGLYFAARAAGGSLPADLKNLSRSVTLGDLDEGWTFVCHYLWLCEHWLLVFWIACVALACSIAVSRKRRHLLWWAVAFGLMYVTLGEMSAGMHKFVIAGRTARSIVPFLALASAGVMAALGQLGRGGRIAQLFVLGGIVLQAGINFRPVVSQYFPPEFRAAALTKSTEVPAADRGRLRVLNAYFFHQAVFVDLKSKHHTLLSAPHPLQFRPYQFDGYRRDQRILFDAHDIAMQLVYLDENDQHLTKMPDPALDGYLGPIRVTLMLPAQRGVYPEPIAVTGRSERGDFLFLDCDPDERTVRVGHDHWGSRGSSSKTVQVDYHVGHTLDISMGSLMPPADSAAYAEHLDWKPLANRLIVLLDGKTLLNEESSFFPSAPYEATIGANLIGGSTTNPNLAATITSVEPLDVESFARKNLP